MGLYELYSHNVEIKYKSYFLSKASLFTFTTTLMNIVLPFIVAYRSRGFWLKSHSFHEQPVVQSTFNYLVIANTDDPTQILICGDLMDLYNLENNFVENCSEMQIQEYNYNNVGEKTNMLNFQMNLNVHPDFKINSILLIFELDFQLRTTCELHMQTLAVMEKDFAIPPSEFHHYGDIEFYQTTHLPCPENIIDTRYNTSLFKWSLDNINIIDLILEGYFKRAVTTHVKTIFSTTQSSFTGNLKLNVHLRVPEMHIKYKPSIMQELKWAWPQYLAFAALFYWLFNRFKKFVFNRRLLMAWEIVPWKSETRLF